MVEQEYNWDSFVVKLQSVYRIAMSGRANRLEVRDASFVVVLE